MLRIDTKNVYEGETSRNERLSDPNAEKCFQSTTIQDNLDTPLEQVTYSTYGFSQM
jgi:hypothetical protein